ncbi:hypothetical protein NUM3379_19780 [Kineococcus sp. NUM-3379]
MTSAPQDLPADPGRALAGVLLTEVDAGFAALFEHLADPAYLWARSGDDFVLVGYNAAAAALPYGDIHLRAGQRPTDILGLAGNGLRGRLERCARSQRPITRRQSIQYDAQNRRHVRISIQPVTAELVMSSTVDETEVVGQVLQAWEEETAHLGELTRSLVHTGDPAQARELLCRASLTLSGADRAYLLEPRGGALRESASAERAGLPGSAGPVEVDLADAASPCVRAFLTRRQQWAGDLATGPAGTARLADALGARAVLVEPVDREPDVLGVLTVCWAGPKPAPPPRARRLLPLLAGHAAAALERSDLVAKLQREALLDPLTGLPNRRSWEEHLERASTHAQRTGQPLSVAVLDIDGLKQTNDTLGHAEGDRLLREAAREWSSTLRRHDVLARVGGDEFGLLLVDTDSAVAEEVLARMTAAVPGVGFSRGVAQWRPGEPVREVVHRADTAMYADKQCRRAARDGGPQSPRP